MNEVRLSPGRLRSPLTLYRVTLAVPDDGFVSGAASGGREGHHEADSEVARARIELATAVGLGHERDVVFQSS
jgi:hypothetical protein